jgi:hypothetical protein
MLLPDNIQPELSVYYNGSIVLKELLKKDNQSIINLYHNIRLANEMSFPTFILCLDWLYIIDVAKINERGYVELCS